jgi:hypothetical protein
MQLAAAVVRPDSAHFTEHQQHEVSEGTGTAASTAAAAARALPQLSSRASAQHRQLEPLSFNVTNRTCNKLPAAALRVPLDVLHQQPGG